jgi:hypothetical protein
MVINGFKFYVRQHDTADKYYVAMRGDVVLTSKSLDYLVKKVKKHA